MNRREFLDATTTVIGGALIGNEPFVDNASVKTEISARQSPSGTLPEEIAGIRLPNSAIMRAATDFSSSVSPPFLFNHALRTFLFGSLIGRALRLTFDKELLYLACVLHDLGLTEHFQGALPFELQGAEAAKNFLSEHGYPANRTAIVWDGIAMHASMIAHFKQPEIMLVGEGAGADVVGPDASLVSKEEVEDLVKAFPRRQFKKAFLHCCADVVREYPGGATRSFMRDVGERYVDGFHPRNFCDLVLEATFSE